MSDFMTGLVKHYKNTMQGIPQLSNNWGSMINLLDAILSTGFNHKPVIGLTKSNTSAMINLGSQHGFIERQVVRITGSSNGWDGDYRILSTTDDSIIVECPSSNYSEISGQAVCFASPLDFDIVFSTPEGSIEPKRAYRSKNPESLGLILLVYDFCSSGANITGAKFAKVGVVSSMININNISGIQMPFDNDNNANWGWSDGYHGWAKWYYKTANHSGSSASVSDIVTPQVGTSNFLFIGNDSSFIFDVDVSDYGKSVTYGLTEFLDQRFNGKNCALFASGLRIKAKQSDSFTPQGRSAIRLGGFNLVNYGGEGLSGAVWFDENGQANYQLCGKSAYIGVGNNTNASLSAASNVVFMPFLISVGNAFVGTIPFIKNTLSSSNLSGFSLVYGGYVTRYFSYEQNTLCIKHGYTLETE